MFILVSLTIVVVDEQTKESVHLDKLVETLHIIYICRTICRGYMLMYVISVFVCF